jgi:hypothetical protein
MYSLIVTAKMNDVDTQAWLADLLGKIAQHPINSLDELLPCNLRLLQLLRAKLPDWRGGAHRMDTIRSQSC